MISTQMAKPMMVARSPQPLQWVGRATHAQPGRRQPVLLGKAARRPLTLACFPAKLTASG